MKNIFVLTVIFSFFHINFINGQNVTKSYTTDYKSVDIFSQNDPWNINLQSMEMAQPGGSSYRSFLFNQKKINTTKYPRKNPSEKLNIKRNTTPSIIIENGFEGNIYNNKVPNDNTLAISDSGMLIAGINSSYIIYDTNNDTLLRRTTLNSITSSFTNLLFIKKYDPKFIYDPVEDRFILVFLVGNMPLNNHVCVAFSSSNDPTDDWNVYMLKGDALDTGHWTDYPAISITDDDLFITGNLLLSGVSWQLGFYQSIIWQIDKNSGYNGEDTLSFNLWSEFKDDSIYVRNIHPARGARELQSKEQYFLSNKNFSLESDTMYLIKIENSQNSNQASSTIKRLSLPNHYFLSPNGRQYTTKELATNDSRVLGAIIDKDWLQFVNHSMDTATGNCGIYHGTITNYNEDNPNIDGTVLADSIIDYGYPNIASTGINPNEKECVIGLNYTSPIDTNGVACIYMDNSSNYSELTKLNTGERAIDRLSGSIDRWGDYSGIQRRYNDPCRVWISGMFGKIGKNGSWISSVAVSDTCRSPIPYLFLEPAFKDATLFPNPTVEISHFDFTTVEGAELNIELYDIEGRLVRTLYKDWVDKGPNRLSFNTTPLQIGIYLVVIKNNESVLFTKKLVKQ